MRTSTRTYRLLLAGGLLLPAGQLVAQEASDSRPAPESTAQDSDEEPIFSGPQVGETLPPLPARYVFDRQAGEEFDPVAKADGKPLLVIFVHDVTRPSVGLTRAVAEYAASRKKDGLETAVIFLGDDATETEEMMKRARHALPQGGEVGISTDGLEGPGAYGLDRKMSLTVLVAKEGKVTANFALVQPSMAVDAPKIAGAIVELVGGEVPKFAQPGVMRDGVSDDEFRALLSPLIQRDATDDEVDAAAARIKQAWARNPAIKSRVGEVASRIVTAGVLENYGTPRAQDHLTIWAAEYDTEMEQRAGQEAKTDSPREAEKSDKQEPTPEQD